MENSPGESQPADPQENTSADLDRELECCPRCGEPVEQIVWGQTNCANCGLHFECC